MAEVQFTDVTKVYPPDVRAVNDFNLTVSDGEFLVIVGPSGCGKTTSMRMVAGLEEITTGTIRIGERVVNDLQPKDRDVAMVFQNYALYPHKTVYNNMAFGLQLRKVPKPQIEQKVRQTAALLGIEELLGRKPKALSGGQRQRVAVGRAIVRSPQCFLFDEPLSNLDAKLRVETRAELKRLHQRLKTTTIYVTHDQEEAMSLGDRVVVMHDGYIQQCDAPLQIYRRPANRFVAGFVGTPAMNFFEGAVAARDGRLWFEQGAMSVLVPGDLAQHLTGRTQSTVTLGIRPEAISDDRSGRFEADGNAVPCTVNVVEPLGDKMDVYLATAENPHVVARIDAHRGIDPGAQQTFYFDMTRAHFFEPGEAGVNLTVGDES